MSVYKACAGKPSARFVQKSNGLGVCIILTYRSELNPKIAMSFVSRKLVRRELLGNIYRRTGAWTIRRAHVLYRQPNSGLKPAEGLVVKRAAQLASSAPPLPYPPRVRYLKSCPAAPGNRAGGAGPALTVREASTRNDENQHGGKLDRPS